MNKQVQVINLGLIDYEEALAFQKEKFQEIIDIKLRNRKENLELPTPNYVIICEHPHVYTLGRNGDAGNLLLDNEGLRRKDAKYYEIGRGGDITYHGPGQLVCYPILDLDNFFTDIHKYLRYLEDAVIETCGQYKLDAGRVEGLTGVWLGHEEGGLNPRKICAMGVRASRWVTMHGLALNVKPDLSYFSNIIPCGIQDKAVTSIEKEKGSAVLVDDVASVLLKALAARFEFEIS